MFPFMLFCIVMHKSGHVFSCNQLSNSDVTEGRKGPGLKEEGKESVPYAGI